MKIITEEQVRSHLNMSDAIRVVRETYKDNAAGKIYAGNRIFMPIRGEENVGQWLVANSLKKPFFGSKFSSVFPGNFEKGLPVTISKISLYSAETGEIQALVDANYLTAIKTGASAAVATDLLARKNATHLAIIGTGLQAFSQVLAIQEVRNLEKITVYDVFPERVEKFIQLLEGDKKGHYSIIAAATADDCVRDADIVCTCTTSLTPVFSGENLKEGAHINAIGSFTSFMQEIDEKTVLDSEKVLTEHVEGLWEAAGDILIPFEAGKFGKEKVTGSLGDALTGKVTGRENDTQQTLYESVGSGVLDIALAIAIYESLSEKGV